jgi:sugar (pentulose or hexulose) kinase
MEYGTFWTKWKSEVQVQIFFSLRFSFSFFRPGLSIKVVTICGGLSKSQLCVQTICDVIGIPVVRPCEAQQSVVLGAAMLGAAASRGQIDTKNYIGVFLSPYLGLGVI